MTLITNKDEQIIELFDSMDDMLNNLEKSLQNNKQSLNDEQYYTDKEVSEQLKISRRTLQDYRNQRIIPYIQLGGKILYKESDLIKLLEENYYQAWRE